ncbi:Polygalacturonase inhibitor 2 [Platanthera guangdongensis]|uniref:Polygalacturonase inhibitor 2 n=1 Tax=Platanthera guangdongensis TaxID=2320717 RepID=A0ABR2LTB2_9ASPA
MASFLPAPSMISLLLLLLSATYAAARPTCNADDKKALLAVKSYFRDPEILADWTADADCCTWDRIQCDDDSGRIVYVSIDGSPTLSGSLPEAISDLPFLRVLYIADLPLLTGPIPQFLTRLRRLNNLILSNTSLSGPIPAFLSQITTLKLLDLSHNTFTGSIPPELSLLRGLGDLLLSNNRLTGGIPASFGSFSIASPPQLDLSNNLLSGEIPAELGRPAWGYIDLSNNRRLEGDASVLFGAAKGTTRMNLSGNKFRFDLSRVSFPTGLGFLYLSRNEINGSIPAQINQLEHLTVLNLSDNKLCGEIPQGPVTGKFGKEAYQGNSCLCGLPLGPCPQSG